MIDHPIPNSYWVLPGRMLAGEYPGDHSSGSAIARVGAIESAGISRFVDLTEEEEGLLPYDSFLATASHHRFPIEDVSVPRAPSLVRNAIDLIDKAIANGEGVYIHCRGGIGRTGLIVGCWLAEHGHPGEAALLRLEELWQECPKSVYTGSPETSAQRRYVSGWRAEE